MNVLFQHNKLTRIISILTISLFLSHVSPTKAQTSFSYHDINIPSTVAVTGFNDKNLAVGFIADNGISKNGDSFVYDLNNGEVITLPKFQQFNPIGTHYLPYYLYPSSINNNGDIPFTVNGAFISSSRYSPQIYNIYSKSSYTSRPSSDFCTFEIRNINNLGQTSGNISSYNCIDSAFFYDQKLGYTTVLNISDSRLSYSLNDNGLMLILDWYSRYSTYDINNKTSTKLPIAPTRHYTSLNNKGHIVGFDNSSGFVYDIASGKMIGFLNIQDADKNSIRLAAINNNDTILGSYSKSGVIHHFLAKPRSNSIKYIALGDSYSSGEGAGSYEKGTNIKGVNQCHRSSKAWSTATPGGDPNSSVPGFPGVNVERQSFACSGAVIDNVISEGQWEAPDHIPQITHPEVANLESSPENNMISITIGGNDIGFGPIIEFCYQTKDCTDEIFDSFSNRTVRQFVEDSLNLLPNRLISTYLNIKEKSNNTPIFVLGYPIIFTPFNLDCKEEWGLTQLERILFGYLGTRLNNVIREAASSAGVHFVDVEAAFSGHESCQSDSYIKGINVLDFDSQETFHPNLSGQAAYATALRQHIVKGNGEIPLNPSSSMQSIKLQANSATSSLLSLGDLIISPALSLTCDNRNRYAPGMQIHIQGKGFESGAVIDAEIRADFGNFIKNIGSFTANAQGRLDAITTIPSDVPLTAGALLRAYGYGSNGTGRILMGDIALVASPEPNKSGNGIPDICGSGNTTSSFTGRIWVDANGNGVQDTTEVGLTNVKVFLDYTGTGVRDDKEPYAITDGAGHFAITDLPTGGGFAVTVDTTTLPAGLKPTFDPDGVRTPHVTHSTVNAGWTSEHNDFGYQQLVSAVGVFRNGQWFLDANGNGSWDGCGIEICFSGFGQAGDMPASGNWDGGSKSYIGVLRSDTGQWFIDRNGNRQWDGCATDGCYVSFGSPGDLPVAGDWTGNGFAKIGVFRNGQWFLDNGNGQWDGCGTDLCLSFGQAGDLPVAGNWNGGLKAGVGVFRAGTWYLDYNGNGKWDGCQQDGKQDQCLFNSFGQAGDFPAAGDWNSDGKAKVGVFRAGTWYLDYNGNGAWDGCSVDRCYYGSFGQQGDLPVAGKW